MPERRRQGGVAQTVSLRRYLPVRLDSTSPLHHNSGIDTSACRDVAGRPNKHSAPTIYFREWTGVELRFLRKTNCAYPAQNHFAFLRKTGCDFVRISDEAVRPRLFTKRVSC